MRVLTLGCIVILAVVTACGGNPSTPTTGVAAAPRSPASTPGPTPSALSSVTGIVFTPPSAPLAGVPASFSFDVTGVPLKDMTVAWGDQTIVDVGAATHGVLAHVYVSAGEYILTISAQGVDGSVNVTSSGPLLVR